MSTLICGSVAFDTIMTFEGRFRNHILPDQIHMLNVSFLVPGMRREFGGCAGNIAYSLKLLGGNPMIMATVGADAGPYYDHLEKLSLSAKHMLEVPEMFTAQAMITTDLDNNQITAFHPGAMSQSHLNKVGDAPGCTLGIVAPDGKQAMMEHAQQLHDANIPFIFDPGQAMPAFTPEDLKHLVELADYVAVNDYEALLLSKSAGWTLEQIAAKVDALIVTKGEKGALIMAGGISHEIPAVEVEAVVDPTGCGDAFRAGLLYGIEHGLDWPTTGRLASLLGSIKVAQRGPQNHHFTPASIAEQFERAFSYKLG
ncbi:MAG: carbohydrate kinase family protein [Candidatus Protistobacter heckmanni]|nr:carbohydrate kinase family protein [Candidatus Protistobacter heckmanni]